MERDRRQELTSAPMVERGILGNLCQRGNGGMVNLTPVASSIVGPVTILDISAENDPAPQACIVTLSRLDLESAIARGLVEPYRIYADISWGTGKARANVTMDYIQGARICLDASSVQVSARYVSSGVSSNELGPRVRLGATLIYGNIGPQATFTDIDETIASAGGQGAIRAIPRFAKEMEFLVDAATSSQMTVTFHPGGRPTAAVSVTVNVNTPVRIPNGVDSYRLQNNDPANNLTFTPMFKLFL